MKKITTLVLSILLVTQTISVTASAQDVQNSQYIQDTQNIQVEHFDDGSYQLTSITEQPIYSSGITLFSSYSTTTKTKTVSYYNRSDKLMWYIQVKGTFTYGNGSAKCTSSQVSAKSYSSNWKLSNKSAKKSGNKATASVTAKFYNLNVLIQTINKTVTLTCSPTGNFS